VVEGKIVFIEVNISARTNFLSDQIIDLVSLFAIRVTNENTWIAS